MNELKECPFCGYEAFSLTWVGGDAVVKCGNSPLLCPLAKSGLTFDVTTWNARPYEEAQETACLIIINKIEEVLKQRIGELEGVLQAVLPVIDGTAMREHHVIDFPMLTEQINKALGTEK